MTTPTDSLRYLYARTEATIAHVSQQLCGNLRDGLDDQQTDSLLDTLEGVLADLRAHLAAHTDHPHTYDDGRAVTSRLELEPGCTYEHVWHPDRAHPVNQPHTVGRMGLRITSGVRVIAGENLAAEPDVLIYAAY